jgi:hypothetical protein
MAGKNLLGRFKKPAACHNESYKTRLVLHVTAGPVTKHGFALGSKCFVIMIMSCYVLLLCYPPPLPTTSFVAARTPPLDLQKEGSVSGQDSSTK